MAKYKWYNRKDYGFKIVREGRRVYRQRRRNNLIERYEVQIAGGPEADPNMQTFTVHGLATGDRVYIADADTGEQYLNTIAEAPSLAMPVTYQDERDLIVRVRNAGRDGGTPIMPFQTNATIGQSGGSLTAIRIADV